MWVPTTDQTVPISWDVLQIITILHAYIDPFYVWIQCMYLLNHIIDQQQLDFWTPGERDRLKRSRGVARLDP